MSNGRWFAIYKYDEHIHFIHNLAWLYNWVHIFIL
jgi:hypothetical protein